MNFDLNFDNFPTTLRSFERRFPTETACEAYLFSRRFPDGFVCARCGSVAKPWRIASRHCLLECSDCGTQISLTTGTVFANTKKPLKDWFWALFEVAVHKTGVSAAHLCRVLGFTEVTGLMWMRKLRTITVRPEREPLCGEVEADTIFFNVQDEEGKGVEVPVAVAIEVKRNIDKFGKEHVMPGRARLGVLKDQSAEEMGKFLKQNVAKDATLITDGGTEFQADAASHVKHEPEVTGTDWERARSRMARLNLIVANFKMWLRGTFHQSPHRRFVQLYLDEFCYRHNRRNTKTPLTPLQRLMEQACRLTAPTWSTFQSPEFGLT